MFPPPGLSVDFDDQRVRILAEASLVNLAEFAPGPQDARGDPAARQKIAKQQLSGGWRQVGQIRAHAPMLGHDRRIPRRFSPGPARAQAASLAATCNVAERYGASRQSVQARGGELLSVRVSQR
jgi:hypothetical protein